MNKDKQRIAIAEACGWRNIWYSNNLGKSILSGKHPQYNIQQAVPDYLNDLNAMHEAKRLLTDEHRPIYWRTLYEVCKTTEWPFNAESWQEAESFLRTIGKWEDEQ